MNDSSARILRYFTPGCVTLYGDGGMKSVFGSVVSSPSCLRWSTIACTCASVSTNGVTASFVFFRFCAGVRGVCSAPVGSGWRSGGAGVTSADGFDGALSSDAVRLSTSGDGDCVADSGIGAALAVTRAAALAVCCCVEGILLISSICFSFFCNDSFSF